MPTLRPTRAEIVAVVAHPRPQAKSRNSSSYAPSFVVEAEGLHITGGNDAKVYEETSG